MKFKIFAILLALTIIFTACGSGNGDSDVDGAYYTGSEGVVANFQRNSPPRNMYYYEDTPDENVFDVFIDLHNKGASYSKGGLYLSGYDPARIKVEGIDIKKTGGNWDDCDVNFGLNSELFNMDSTGYFGEGGSFWKGFAGAFDCADSGIAAHYSSDTQWGASLEDLGAQTGWEWLDEIGFEYNHNEDLGDSFSLDFGDDFNVQYLNHGAGLAVLMGGMSFNWYNGREYFLLQDNMDYPGGEFTTEDFIVHVDSWPQNLHELHVPFMLTNCYIYSTFVNEMVCIDPAPNDNREKVCQSRIITDSRGQGGPVAITKIETISTKVKSVFSITIENIGNGQIFDIGQMNKCGPYGPGLLTSKDVDRVYILDARIGDQQLKCTPDRGAPIILMDNARNVRCEYNIDYQTVKTAYETPLIIELGYGYQEISQVSMDIKKV